MSLYGSDISFTMYNILTYIHGVHSVHLFPLCQELKMFSTSTNTLELLN